MSDTFDHEADAWDSLDWYDSPAYGYGRRAPVCKFCGKVGMDWIMTRGGWRLKDPKEPEAHYCGEYLERKHGRGYSDGMGPIPGAVAVQAELSRQYRLAGQAVVVRLPSDSVY